jgi:hypothetical protein
MSKTMQGQAQTGAPKRVGPHDGGSVRLDQAGTKAKDTGSNSDRGANRK